MLTKHTTASIHRTFTHMSPRNTRDRQQALVENDKEPIPTKTPTPTTTTPVIKNDNDPLNLNQAAKTIKEQRDADWSIIRKLIGHIWPKGDRGTKVRVVLALGLLIGGKVSEIGANNAAFKY
jgi:ATP-binding cassette subfamily B (MDR/TAP) protein 7